MVPICNNLYTRYPICSATDSLLTIMFRSVVKRKTNGRLVFHTSMSILEQITRKKADSRINIHSSGGVYAKDHINVNKQ